MVACRRRCRRRSSSSSRHSAGRAAVGLPSSMQTLCRRFADALQTATPQPLHCTHSTDPSSAPQTRPAAPHRLEPVDGSRGVVARGAAQPGVHHSHDAVDRQRRLGDRGGEDDPLPTAGALPGRAQHLVLLLGGQVAVQRQDAHAAAPHSRAVLQHPHKTTKARGVGAGRYGCTLLCICAPVLPGQVACVLCPLPLPVGFGAGGALPLKWLASGSHTMACNTQQQLLRRRRRAHTGGPRGQQHPLKPPTHCLHKLPDACRAPPPLPGAAGGHSLWP